MDFELEGAEIGYLMRDTAGLYQKFSSQEGSTSDDDFLDFSINTINEQVEVSLSISIASKCNNDINCCCVCVMEYQAIFFVLPGAEYETNGYFFKVDDALQEAKSLVYDDCAEKEYQKINLPIIEKLPA